MEVVNEMRLMITTSTDCCARLWTWSGSFIGTFGQPTPWDITSTTSVNQRMGPFDVLIDPSTHVVPEFQAIIANGTVTRTPEKSNRELRESNIDGYAAQVFGPPSVGL